MRSTIMTHDEGSIFETLFEMNKKIQHLILNSEYWMVGEEDQDNIRIFLRNIN
jgi:hypothetical protein